jgi:hypothetical protein
MEDDEVAESEAMFANDATEMRRFYTMQFPADYYCSSGQKTEHRHSYQYCTHGKL